MAWGSSERGQCGHESEAIEFSVPRAVKALRGRYVCEVACGAAHTLVLTSTGEVLSCGIGVYGALGHGDLNDVRQPKLVQVRGWQASLQHKLPRMALTVRSGRGSTACRWCRWRRARITRPP